MISSLATDLATGIGSRHGGGTKIPSTLFLGRGVDSGSVEYVYFPFMSDLRTASYVGEICDAV